MTPYQAFTDWHAMKAHFTNMNYDYVKYHGRTPNDSESDYENSRFRNHFIRIANHYSPRWLMLSTLVEKPTAWITDTKGEKAEELLTERLAKVQALKYTFSQELKLLKDDFVSNIRYDTGEHPYVVRLFLGGKISIETLTIFCSLTKRFELWGVGTDHVLEGVTRKAFKYKTFIPFDELKYREILIDRFKKE